MPEENATIKIYDIEWCLQGWKDCWGHQTKQDRRWVRWGVPSDFQESRQGLRGKSVAGEVPGRTGRMGNGIPRSPWGINPDLVRKEVSPWVYSKGKELPSEWNRGNIKLVRFQELLNNLLTSFVTEVGFLCKVLGVLNGLLSLLYPVQPQNHEVKVNGTFPSTLCQLCAWQGLLTSQQLYAPGAASLPFSR